MKRMFIRVYHYPSDQYWDSETSECSIEEVREIKKTLLTNETESITVEDEDGNFHFFNKDVLKKCIISIFVNDAE